MEALRKYLEQYNDRATWEAFCGEAVVAEEALALLQQAEEENLVKFDYWRLRSDRLEEKLTTMQGQVAKLESERPECHDCKWARRGNDGTLYKCLAASLDCNMYQKAVE